ncbi:hypothetical protein PoB_002434800 [Plakobranchus ocellatus]|uniref:Uncharacterized protein n=1 Tax=Plakobranchus ocellatus TaxID=259542 RepID=A0AAV3ZTP3_9GAST|nr:hypothetical protein PoB_002434800 [Plakobranchus ocellatus]
MNPEVKAATEMATTSDLSSKKSPRRLEASELSGEFFTLGASRVPGKMVTGYPALWTATPLHEILWRQDKGAMKTAANVLLMSLRRAMQ